MSVTITLPGTKLHLHIFINCTHALTHTAPSGHILTKEELYILRRLLADYSDSKLKEISRRFEENQDGDIVREEVESALREKGLASIADDLKENLEKGYCLNMRLYINFEIILFSYIV